MSSGLNGIDVSILLASLAIVLAIGLIASRRGHDSAATYFLAMGKMPWWLIGPAFMVTSISSEQLVGSVGRAYVDGMKIANMEWFNLPIIALMLAFFLPIFLLNRITTMPDFLRQRFSPVVGDAYGWIMLVAYVVVFLVPVFYGAGACLADLTGWNYYLIVWTMIAVVGAYALTGGLVSVMWTDLAQCVMLIGGGLVLYFAALHQIPGGWAAMVRARPERFHLYAPPGDPILPFLGRISMTFGLSLFFNITNQVMIQRVLGARSVRDGFLGVIVSGFIGFVRPLVVVFLGFIVYHWIFVLKRAQPLANFDLAFSFALRNLAPGWGIRGIVLAGFIAAIMSHVSALLNSISTMFTLDIYQRALSRPASDKELIRVGRAVGLAALILSGLLSPLVRQLGGIYVYFQTSVTYLATPFASVFLMGIFWKRTNWQGALFGIVGGLVIQLAVALCLPALGFHWNWSYYGGIAQVLVMASMVLVSLGFPPPAESAWRPFLWSPRLLGRMELDAGLAWYKTVRFWFGVFAVIWLWVYWRFW